MVFIALAVVAPARAEDAPPAPAPDKSQYTLFNPTPDDQMRSFCTDRPTRSNLACTVDTGHTQYEADMFNWTYNSVGGVTQNTYLVTNPTFKLGLTNSSDFELNMVPFEEVTVHDSATHQTQHLSGNGDLFVRYKYSFLGDDSGDIAFTLLPYVKVPAAEPGIGNKAFEEGIIAPVSYNLPGNYLLLFDPEADALKNIQNNGYHANYQGLVNLSHTLFTDSLTAAGELWTDNNRDPSGTVEQASADFALSWVAVPNLQLDFGANIGLNRATPDFQGYAGISQRF